MGRGCLPFPRSLRHRDLDAVLPNRRGPPAVGLSRATAAAYSPLVATTLTKLSEELGVDLADLRVIVQAMEEQPTEHLPRKLAADLRDVLEGDLRRRRL